ncbi:MAG: helix-turn-helix domain-containing protein [Oscillospiraceae bacterium]|nr:helix-turn-helix domain-containing protein [Oscillospiraceae bacterium]
MLYIAGNLKRLRKEKDLTQEEVAQMLNVSPQSVSKWERGETIPDITLLPALSNLYKVSVDTLIGMDKINSQQMRNDIFTAAHTHMRNGETAAAVQVFTEAIKTYPNDEGIMSDLAMALALGDDPESLQQAITLCERLLSDNQGDKVHHTTRAALCFIFLKAGEKDKSIEIARRLPHLRESRESVLAQIESDLSVDDINAYLKFIGFGGSDEQDIVEIDFGTGMIAVCAEHGLLNKIKALRDEYNAPTTRDGLRIIPNIRVRDKAELLPGQVRVRHLADYLLDKEFSDPVDATAEIIEALRKIAEVRSSRG